MYVRRKTAARDQRELTIVELADTDESVEDYDACEPWPGEGAAQANERCLSEDLAALRSELYARGIMLMVRMSPGHTLRSIRWGSFCAYQAPESWKQLRNFCKITRVPWKAANIGTCVMRCV